MKPEDFAEEWWDRDGRRETSKFRFEPHDTAQSAFLAGFSKAMELVNQKQDYAIRMGTVILNYPSSNHVMRRAAAHPGEAIPVARYSAGEWKEIKVIYGEEAIRCADPVEA